MRQNPRQVREEAFVDGEQAFCFDGLGEAVEDAGVEVASLVVHAGHDGVWIILAALADSLRKVIMNHFSHKEGLE